MLKLFIFAWFVIEVLQIIIIGMLVIGYRRMQRRLEENHRWSLHPPPSVTEELGTKL